jgi:carbon storage regulator
MLTLTRRPNETVVIETSDGTIYITVSGIKGNQVRINFEAPDDVDIWREELLDNSAA